MGNLGFGGSNTSTVQTTELTPEQRADLQAKTNFLTSTIIPTYQQAVGGATDVYNRNIGGVTNAAQNLAGTAAQAQNVLGSTGESALKTGISGLENVFNPDYAKQQLQSVMAPAQQEYEQNLAMQQNQFGGAGQLGSARQALADQNLASLNRQRQAGAGAQVMSDIAKQQIGAGTTLAGLGQSGLGQALGAAGQGVTAAGIPIDTFNKYISAIFGTPATSFTSDYRGTQSSTTDSSKIGGGIGKY
jgi:hypothetical protein